MQMSKTILHQISNNLQTIFPGNFRGMEMVQFFQCKRVLILHVLEIHRGSLIVIQARVQSRSLPLITSRIFHFNDLIVPPLRFAN